MKLLFNFFFLLVLNLILSTYATQSSTIELPVIPVELEGFTIVISTFKRNEILKSLISHLITKPPKSLRLILILWQNVDEPLPLFLTSQQLERLNLPIKVKISDKNSMNFRFNSFKEIQTESILILDDDLILTNNNLEWGYKQFKSIGNLNQLTGFTPRNFKFNKLIQSYSYELFNLQQYSLILTNAAFVRKEWLSLYSANTSEMIKLRNYVDEVFNCDDILFNFVVSNYTHLPPLLLQPSIPLRTIQTPGLWNRSSSSFSSSAASLNSPVHRVSSTYDENAPPSATPSATSSLISPSPKAELNHFEIRNQCLNYFFKYFSKYASSNQEGESNTNSKVGYPLIENSISISQDLKDYSRTMREGESWEEERSENYIKHVESLDNDTEEGEEEGIIETEEEKDTREWEERFENMTDEEIYWVIQGLEEEMKREELEDSELTKEEKKEEKKGRVIDEL